MAYHVGILDHHGKGLRHEKGGVEAALGQTETLNPAPVKGQIMKTARLPAPGSDHDRRTVDACHRNSLLGKQLAMWRIAAGDVQGAAHRAAKVARPHLLQKTYFLGDLARPFHVNDAENVR